MFFFLTFRMKQDDVLEVYLYLHSVEIYDFFAHPILREIDVLNESSTLNDPKQTRFCQDTFERHYHRSRNENIT